MLLRKERNFFISAVLSCTHLISQFDMIYKLQLKEDFIQKCLRIMARQHYYASATARKDMFNFVSPYIIENINVSR